MPTLNDSFFQCRDIVCRIFSPESLSLILNLSKVGSDSLEIPEMKRDCSVHSLSAGYLKDYLILKRTGDKHYLTKFGAVLKSKLFSLFSELNGCNSVSSGNISSEDLSYLSDYLMSVYDCCDSDNSESKLSLVDAVLESGKEKLLNDIHNFISLVIENPEYFMIHHYEGLPDFAFENIGMLCSARLVCDPTVNYKQNLEFYHTMLKEADHIHGISTWGSGDIGSTMINCLNSGAEIELVISGKLASSLIMPPYLSNIDEYRDFDKLSFFVTDEIIPVGLTVTDKKMSLGFFLNDRTTYDSIHDFICRSDSCLSWSEELFSYYKDKSLGFEEYLNLNGCL